MAIRTNATELGHLRGGRRQLEQPSGGDQRRQAEQQGRQQDRKGQGEEELRQADFGEQAAGDGEQGSLLRAGDVVFDITSPRID
jgi:hypothetical protein